ncbi:MAG TPA: kelch repeat-containing protein [Thermoplasmata archaeon]|nr:kelch repeat-containing protein [Thermoplasmata archaeon]
MVSSTPSTTSSGFACGPPGCPAREGIASRLASNPGNWQNITAGLVPSPSPRVGAAVAYDANDGYFVLFGGRAPNGSLLTDTWVFQSDRWISLTSKLGASHTPPPTAFAAIADDPRDGYVVMLGGTTASEISNSMWAFSGGVWTDLDGTITVRPPARTNASMTFDSNQSELVLFGGANSTRSLRDTWTYRSSTWLSLTPANLTGTNSPSRRTWASMAFDVTSGLVVLFGGLGNGASLTGVAGDTWWFNGTAWKLDNATASAPAKRLGAAFAFDNVSGRLILFGGQGSGGAPLSDTWSFSGGLWTDLTPLVGLPPAARWEPGAAVAYSTPGHPDQLLLLFGGAATASGYLADTWLIDAAPLQATPVAVPHGGTDVLVPVAVSVVAFGGIPPYSYSWKGLPQGCSGSNNSTIVCTPTAPGAFTPTATVADATGIGSIRTSGTLQVNDRPTITVFVVSPSAPVAYVTTITMSVTASGGTGALAYSYAGLPPGCASTNTSEINCTATHGGTYSVVVTVTDGIGVTVNASTLVLIAASTPGPFWTSTRIAILIIGIGALDAVLIGVYYWYRRKSRPPAPRPPPPPAKPPSTATAAAPSNVRS